MEKVIVKNDALKHTAEYEIKHAENLIKGKVNRSLPVEKKFYLSDPGYRFHEGRIVSVDYIEEMNNIKDWLCKL